MFWKHLRLFEGTMDRGWLVVGFALWCAIALSNSTRYLSTHVLISTRLASSVAISRLMVVMSCLLRASSMLALRNAAAADTLPDGVAGEAAGGPLAEEGVPPYPLLPTPGLGVVDRPVVRDELSDPPAGLGVVADRGVVGVSLPVRLMGRGVAVLTGSLVRYTKDMPDSPPNPLENSSDAKASPSFFQYIPLLA